VKRGPKRGQPQARNIHSLSPFDQAEAAFYGEAFAKDIEAFEWAQHWMALGVPNSPSGQAYRATLEILGPKRAAEIEAAAIESAKAETWTFVADICKTGNAPKLRHIADAIEILKNPDLPVADWETYAIVSLALSRDRDFWKRPIPRRLPFDYAEIKRQLGKHSSRTKIYEAKAKLRAIWKSEKGTV
jgi:hypothetical protein